MTDVAKRDQAFLAGFTHLQVMHALEFVDSSLSVVRNLSTFDIRADREERFFRREFTWTGRGIEKPPHVVSGRDQLGHASHRIHGPVVSSGTRRVYFVDLGRDLMPGDADHLAIQQTFIDLQGALEPYLSCTARTGCEQINLRVTFPDGVPVRVSAFQYPTGSLLAEVGTVLMPSENRKEMGVRQTYDFEVKNPTIGVRYAINWEAVPRENELEPT